MRVNFNSVLINNHSDKINNAKTTVIHPVQQVIIPKEQSFTGKKDDISWLQRIFGKYSEYLYEKEWMQKLVDKCSKNKDKVFDAIQIFGSLITSGVYVYKTLQKKDLDDDAKKTLAINQTLCFIIPTIGALTLDSLMKDWARNKEYKYSAKQEHKRALANLSPEEFAKSVEEQSARLRGLRQFTKLVTFILMYRYLTPVFVTPLANKWGAKRNAKRKAEAERLAQQQNNNEMIKPLNADKKVSVNKAG